MKIKPASGGRHGKKKKQNLKKKILLTILSTIQRVELRLETSLTRGIWTLTQEMSSNMWFEHLIKALKLQDLKKAQNYLNHLIELERKRRGKK